jgi:hypothetical protein
LRLELREHQLIGRDHVLDRFRQAISAQQSTCVEIAGGVESDLSTVLSWLADYAAVVEVPLLHASLDLGVATEPSDIVEQISDEARSAGLGEFAHASSLVELCEGIGRFTIWVFDGTSALTATSSEWLKEELATVVGLNVPTVVVATTDGATDRMFASPCQSWN